MTGIATNEEIQALVADSERVHYIIPMTPRSLPGATEFCVRLEYTYFIPADEPLNALLSMHIVYIDDVFTFGLLSIPKDRHWAAEAIAAALDLRLVNEKYPSTMGPEGFKPWKFPSPTSYMLSANPGHWAYNNDFRKLQEAYTKEDSVCGEIIHAHNKKYNVG